MPTAICSAVNASLRVRAVVVPCSAIVTAVDRLAETLPAASLAQAYASLSPEAEKVKVVGALVVHPTAPEEGTEDVSVIRYPANFTESVAVRLVTGTEREVAVAGIVKVLTTGAAVSGRVMVTVSERLEDTFPAASLAQA